MQFKTGEGEVRKIKEDQQATSECLANMVLVKKLSGACRMCVDFRDLNKACLKDNHPLPEIDRLVNIIVGHALLSFMDPNVGSHQIPMAEHDRVHTAFITIQGVYCSDIGSKPG